MLHLKKRLNKRIETGTFRQLQISEPRIDFSSNDYLGLSRSPKLAEAFEREWKIHSSRLGSTGSRLLTGNSNYAEDLEGKIAKFHGFEAGSLFNCGYMANVGLILTIAARESVILFDERVHASMRDGIRLSRSHAFPFRHNDLAHLENRLKKTSSRGSRFICVESIYSTDGTCAPLKEICQLAKKYDARLIVDEAHAVGIFGPSGRGLAAEHNLAADVFALVATFGKALGTFGAIVLGNNLLKQAIVNFATPYIYTTALPLQNLAAIKCSYDLFPSMENERLHLKRLISLFKHSSTQIQPVQNANPKQTAQKLSAQGFDVKALLSPTVQRGAEILRICLHAFNTESELAKLKRALYAL